MRNPGWHMSNYQQWTSALVVLVVVGVVLLGLYSMLRDQRKRESVEQYTQDFISENADVLAVQEAHPVNMPRWKGWRGARPD